MIGSMNSLQATVLVIESHPIMRTALCTAIAEEPDLQVAELDVNNQQDLAISLLGEVHYFPCNLDIILFALGNPGQKDLEALTTLRAILPDVPVLALTSSEVPGQELAAIEAGAQAVVTKTASRSEIIHALREMHGKHLFHSQK